MKREEGGDEGEREEWKGSGYIRRLEIVWAQLFHSATHTLSLASSGSVLNAL